METSKVAGRQVWEREFQERVQHLKIQGHQLEGCEGLVWPQNALGKKGGTKEDRRGYFTACTKCRLPEKTLKQTPQK